MIFSRSRRFNLSNWILRLPVFSLNCIKGQSRNLLIVYTLLAHDLLKLFLILDNP